MELLFLSCVLKPKHFSLNAIMFVMPVQNPRKMDIPPPTVMGLKLLQHDWQHVRDFTAWLVAYRGFYNVVGGI